MAQKKKPTKKTPKKTTKKQKVAEAPTWKSRLLKWAFVACIWVGLFVLAIVAWYGKDLAKIANRVKDENQRIVRVYAKDGVTELAAYGHLRGENIRIEDLPPHVPNAFIAIEDRRFYSHFGIDLIGLARAMVTNVKAGGIVQGGSTITQQLAKNLFFSPERTLKRKIQEALLALWIEYKYSKEEILSAYLNHVYFGSGAYGIDSASHIYFNKSPQDLGIKESALLAGLMQAPSRLSPYNNPQAAIDRMKVVLDDMVEVGFVTREMVKDADNITITDGKINGMEIARRSKSSHYFTDWIYRQVNMIADDIDGNIEVITTLSPNLQDTLTTIAQQEIDNAYPEDGEKKRPEVAAVILNDDGAIRAMVGGYDYNDSQFNRATDSNRQAGSSFKPFVYLAAVEQGWRPNDLISNERITSGKYRPSNYDGKYAEEVTLREALAMSYNVSAVRLIQEVGVPHVIDLAERIGIDSTVRNELSTALGTVDIPLLDLVGGYATIGQKGRLVTPYGIQSIKQENGEVLYQYQATPPARVIAQQHTNAITSMMEDVVKYGTGRRADAGFPVAGKTGTTQDYRDALFIGFSSTYTIGVWMGHDDNSSMGKGAYGGTVPASIFRRAMQTAHRYVQPRALSDYDDEGNAPDTGIKSFINDLFSKSDNRKSGFWNFGSSDKKSNSNNSEPRDNYDFNQ